jgi:hypothetical protein
MAAAGTAARTTLRCGLVDRTAALMARPSKFKAEFVEQARKLAYLGATDREAADFFGVTEQTINNWKSTNAEFFEALKVGKETADARVEQSLYRRALGYTHDAVKIMTVDGAVVQTPYVEHYPPDTTAAIFWLKNRRADRWRDVKAQEVSGPNGAPVRHQMDMSTLTDDQLDALAAITIVDAG